jgi:sulfate permease, SulP family
MRGRSLRRPRQKVSRSVSSRPLSARALVRRLCPFLDWIGELRNPQTVRADVIAGVTVALILIPQSMAYAQLAGLPVQYGLYAAFLPPIVAALFGSSRQLATGPVAVVSLMTAAAVGPLVIANPDAYIAYALLLALMVGMLQLLLGVLRLGILMDFLSHPVVVGFTNAGALIIASSQLGKLFGVSVPRYEHHYETVWYTLEAAAGASHLPTIGMAALALAIMIMLKQWAPRVPAVLVAVVVTTLLAWASGFQAAGGAVVGDIPVGLPRLAAPTLEWVVMAELLVAAATISLIGFMEAMSIAKAIAARTRQRLDANRELIGQGLANMASAACSGYPVSGSFSRSAVNSNAGAVTGFASVVTGLVVAVALVWLTPLLYHLPQATLAAVIIMAVANLVKVRPIVHAWRAERGDGVVAVTTFALTLLWAPHLDKGILAGVGLSLVLFLLRTMRPRFAVLSCGPDGTMRDAAVHCLETSPKIAVVRFDGALYFANAGYFETKVLGVVADRPELEYIIIDAEGINQIDSSGEEVLRHLTERLRAQGIDVLLARMKHQCVETLRRTGYVGLLGEDHLHARISFALESVWDRLGDRYDRSRCPLGRPQPAVAGV